MLARTECNKVIAKAILEAVAMREGSYRADQGAYQCSKGECARACSPDRATAELVRIMICAAWNDSIRWAEGVMQQ